MCGVIYWFPRSVILGFNNLEYLAVAILDSTHDKDIRHLVNQFAKNSLPDNRGFRFHTNPTDGAQSSRYFYRLG